jgi:hypothetical protein
VIQSAIMWSMQGFMRWAFAMRWTDVHEPDIHTMELSSGSLRTRLDRNTSQVLRQGKLVARFDQIQGVEVERILADGPNFWRVMLELRGPKRMVLGPKRIAIGEVSDHKGALVLRERVAAFCGKQVTAERGGERL